MVAVSAVHGLLASGSSCLAWSCWMTCLSVTLEFGARVPVTGMGVPDFLMTIEVPNVLQPYHIS